MYKGIHLLTVNPTVQFPTFTMREDHRRFLKVGALVSAAATAFDEPEGPRWSESVYGDRWATARVTGKVLMVQKDRIRVRWSDNTTSTLCIDELELDGDTLRRAEAAIAGNNNS